MVIRIDQSELLQRLQNQIMFYHVFFFFENLNLNILNIVPFLNALMNEKNVESHLADEICKQG